MSNPSNAPVSLEQLAAFVLGELPPADRDQLAAAIAGDTHLTGELRRLEQIVEVMRTDDSVLPPRPTVERAIGIMAMVTSPGHSIFSSLNRAAAILASIIFDSRAQAAVAGFRGALAGHQLGFSCPACEIDLQIAQPAPGSTSFTLRGAIDTTSGAPATHVALAHRDSSEPITQAPVDEHGNFRIESGAGDFDLLIAVGDAMVVVEALRLE